ncbi:hypothetical protein PMAC_000444 [Pneumocystis sp. 'macacae']|nr:hypothetical protein PMAC_000444 [Pneumocystis sp. 'macacae']
MNIAKTKTETIFGIIIEEYDSNKSGNTLEEPVYMTIYNDIKIIGIKLSYILWPRDNYDVLNNWDLWGPFIFSLILSSSLSLTAPKNEPTIVFTGIFCVIWISELIITLNLKLLGIPMYNFNKL